jgi:hypothetical protein
MAGGTCLFDDHSADLAGASGHCDTHRSPFPLWSSANDQTV